MPYTYKPEDIEVFMNDQKMDLSTKCFYKQPPSSGFFGKMPVMSEVQRQDAIKHGKPYMSVQDGHRLTFHYYKDCWYLTEYEEIKNDR